MPKEQNHFERKTKLHSTELGQKKMSLLTVSLAQIRAASEIILKIKPILQNGKAVTLQTPRFLS